MVCGPHICDSADYFPDADADSDSSPADGYGSASYIDACTSHADQNTDATDTHLRSTQCNLFTNSSLTNYCRRYCFHSACRV